MEITRTAVEDRFRGKVAIVTGGSSGIGRAIVEELCREGARVAFCGLSDIGHTTERDLAAAGHEVLFFRGDMADDAFRRSLVERTVARWGSVNCLVNNAFSFVAKGEHAEVEDFLRSYHAGPIAYARMVQFCIEPMKRAGGGAVVNMSSISAHIAQIDRWTYNMSKGAVNQLTKCQALDLAKYRIRVNGVDPGWIWTREVDKASQVDGGGREKWEPVWGDYHMLRRTGEAVEVAGPTLFLLSDDASFITGTHLPVDAGYLSMGPEGIGQTTVVAGSW
jgi:NAD(P)-dependent dehydrogenase (short-subunit alcohol dehydrogenase family)